MSEIIEIIPEDFSEENIRRALEDKILLDNLNGVKNTKINDVLDSIVKEVIKNKSDSEKNA